MVPDGLNTVWHFCYAAQLTPGRTREVKITALGSQQHFPAAQLCKKAQVATGLAGYRHFHRLSARAFEV